MIRAIVLCLSVALVQGCSAFTPPKLKPVIEDRISEHDEKTVGVLATTPERRIVLVKMPEQLFCAEPSPDAADNVSHAISAALEASTTGKLSEAQIGVAQKVATSVRQLFQRSQGIQLYRDGNFMLCNSYLNGVIKDEAKYLAQQDKILQAAKELILAEITELSKLKFDTNTPPAQAATAVELKGGSKSKAGGETKSPEPEKKDE